jgi:hypothetical protein
MFVQCLLSGNKAKLNPVLSAICACVYCNERKVDPDETYNIENKHFDHVEKV